MMPTPPPWSNLPEVVPCENAAVPQVCYEGIERLSPLSDDLDQCKDPSAVAVQQVGNRAGPFWKRRARIFGILGAVLACAALAGTLIGVLVPKHQTGSSKMNPNSTSSSPLTTTGEYLFGTPTSISEPLPPSPCKESMCPQMLSYASFDKPPTTFLFGRGVDRAIWYRQAGEDGWMTEWNSLGGEFLSPPSSVSIRDGRIDVFAVDEDNNVQVRTMQDGDWGDDWLNLSGRCSSQPASVSFGVDKLSMICVDADHLARLKYYKGSWGPSITDWTDLSGQLLSAPALASGGLFRVDIVAYGTMDERLGKDAADYDYSMIYKRFNTTTWLDWEGGWGSFKGDPAIVAETESHVEYFGIGKNGTMWHNEWSQDDAIDNYSRRDTRAFDLPPGYTEPENLGGDFISSPFAFIAATNRLDVLAVGVDGHLKHQARIENMWLEKWEDLGGFFGSAPLAFSRGNSDTVHVFGIGMNDSVTHGDFTVGQGGRWGEGQWFADGGEIATTWYGL